MEYNKWFPFTRKQLERNDPRANSLFQRMWDVNFPSSAGTVAPEASTSSSYSSDAEKKLGDWWDSTLSISPECQNVTTAFASGLIKTIEHDDDDDSNNEENEEEEADDEEDKDAEDEEKEDKEMDKEVDEDKEMD